MCLGCIKVKLSAIKVKLSAFPTSPGLRHSPEVGDLGLAYQAFKIAISVDPNHAESYNNIGVLELRKAKKGYINGEKSLGNGKGKFHIKRWEVMGR